MRTRRVIQAAMMIAMIAALVGCETRREQPDAAPKETASTKKSALEERPDATPKEEPAVSEEEGHLLEGVVEKIRFQNINKMKGRYSYNVELRVRATKITPDHQPTNMNGEPVEVFTVRIGKVHWRTLSKQEQDAISPDGPKNTLDVQKYKGHVVGEPLSMKVKFTSVGLAHKL